MADAILNPCSFCGNPAPARQTINRRGEVCTNVFCSRACYDASRTAERKKRTQTCAHCQQPFIPYAGRVVKFCSHDCRIAAKRVPPKNCINCGCLFTPIKLMKRTGGAVYVGVTCYSTCSDACDREWRRRNPIRKEKISKAFKGKNHPNWMGGRSWLNNASYRGPNWKVVSDRARKRDGFKCQHCGMTQEECLAKSGRDLDVHHIVPFHNWPNAKAANKMSNLITLCASCHRIEEAKCEQVQMTLLFSDHKHGRRPGRQKGSQHASAKLHDLQVIEIRSRADAGEALNAIATHFGISTSNVSAIVKGKTWKSLPVGETAGDVRQGRNGGARGEANATARFTEADIMDIRNRAYNGERFDAIGLDYDLTYPGVHQIVTGKCWKHLPVLGYVPHSTHRFLRGSEQSKAKVSEEDVKRIRIRHGNGESIASIALDYPLTENAVSYIIKRKTWKHVE